MAEFKELVRNFDKIRDYMRDFYIYGFRSRSDFKHKSPRTYDNEKRRIESYMGDYMQWEYNKSGKNAFISMDCSELSVNPLYAAWKAKVFTDNDIMLHFYLLDALSSHDSLSMQELADLICDRSTQVFDVQTIRNKCKEYVKLGLLHEEKTGKAYRYALSDLNFQDMVQIAPGLTDAVKFFQGSSPLGEIGSFVMDSNQIKNDFFSFNHYYVAHTLEDQILLDCLLAIRSRKHITMEINNHESKKITGLPLKIFVSSKTGRRYVCICNTKTKRFSSHRLDYIKSVTPLETCDDAQTYISKLKQILPKLWGVSFGKQDQSHVITMTLHIDEENEGYILARLKREGKNGTIKRLAKNTFLYTKEIANPSDIAPWIKTFTGRILRLSGSDPIIVRKFYQDMKKMNQLYEDEL